MHRFSLRLGGEAQFKFKARLGGGICFDAARFGSKIRFGAASFALLFARAVKFYSLRLYLARPQRRTHSFSSYVPLLCFCLSSSQSRTYPFMLR